MGKIISSINITLDGFCSHTSVIADEEHHQFAIEQMKTIDIVLFGRITYQLFESFWPGASTDMSLPEWMREYSQYINAARKIVFSKTMKSVSWQNTQLLREIDADYIAQLKNGTDKDIVVYGSPSIICEFLDLKLIDECNFLVQPVIAREGKRFPERINPREHKSLKIKSVDTFKSGVVNLFYECG